MQEVRFVIHTLRIHSPRKVGEPAKEKAARPMYELEREGARRRWR
jgi:hypothetical protein